METQGPEAAAASQGSWGRWGWGQPWAPASVRKGSGRRAVLGLEFRFSSGEGLDSGNGAGGRGPGPSGAQASSTSPPPRQLPPSEPSPRVPGDRTGAGLPADAQERGSFTCGVASPGARAGGSAESASEGVGATGASPWAFSPPPPPRLRVAPASRCLGPRGVVVPRAWASELVRSGKAVSARSRVSCTFPFSSHRRGPSSGLPPGAAASTVGLMDCPCGLGRPAAQPVPTPQELNPPALTCPQVRGCELRWLPGPRPPGCTPSARRPACAWGQPGVRLFS